LDSARDRIFESRVYLGNALSSSLARVHVEVRFGSARVVLRRLVTRTLCPLRSTQPKIIQKENQ
jgi:hypothetical protein